MIKLPSPPPDTSKGCTPHLLPCSIHYNGPVDAKPRYWNPTLGEDGKLEAYFRGRKLKGREVGVPRGYTGCIVRGKEGAGESRREQEREEEEETENGEESEEVQVLEDVASFDKIVLWGHESLVEGDDPFVKGVKEWIGFAEAMHTPGKADRVS